MEIKESDLTFTFDDKTNVIKFDDTNFYRKSFNKLPGGKGVDIIADNADCLQLIEVKNCIGHEAENVWRTSTNNGRAPKGEDSFDNEVAKKVAATIACLYGAWSRQNSSESAQKLNSIWTGACQTKIPSEKKRIFIVLFLEGYFGTSGPESRSKKTIMKQLQDSIESKLSWLNCRVSVVDSTTYSKKLFDVK